MPIQFDDDSGLHLACVLVALHALIPHDFPMEDRMPETVNLAFGYADLVMEKVKARMTAGGKG